MTALALSCALLAVWWGVAAPASRGLEDRLAVPRVPGRPSGRRWLAPALAVLLTSLALVVAVLLGGPRSGVLVLAGVLLASVVIWLVRQRRRVGRALRAQVEVAQACQVLSSHLRVGQVPTDALAVAAADCPVLVQARQVHDVGGEVTAVWRSQGRLPGHGGLIELARAWQVCRETGAPLSTTLEQVAVNLSAEEALRAVVGGELASSRATSKVMAVLPACGIGLGYLLGGDPVDWLLNGPAGWACLVGGVLLAGAGVVWIEVLADQAGAER